MAVPWKPFKWPIESPSYPVSRIRKTAKSDPAEDLITDY